MASSISIRSISGVVVLLSLMWLSFACSQAATPTVESGNLSGDEIQPKPEGAKQVDVKLGEWVISPSATEVQSGQIYFLAENFGPNDPHEMVIIKTDLPPDQLPNTNGKVDEDQLDVIGEIQEFGVGSKASGTFNLAAGNYVLVCNIVQQENGKLESHYLEGMRTAFTVK